MNKKRKVNLANIFALVFSAMALLISIYEANIMSAQQKAIVWPYLRIDNNFNADGFSIIASNNGIGPCIINSVEVIYNNEVIQSYEDLFKKVSPKKSLGYDQIKVSKLNNTVLRSGEERVLLRVPIGEETNDIVAELMKVNYKVQYASTLGELWSFNKNSGEVKEEKFKSKNEFKN